MDRGNEQRGKGHPFRELSFVKNAVLRGVGGLGRVSGVLRVRQCAPGPDQRS